MNKPIEITDRNFKKEVIRSDKPVLIDFWAEWCAPCKMVGAVVKDIDREYGDQIKVGKLDVDANQKTASKYKVMSIPTLILFENGKIKDKVVGYMPKNSLVKKLRLR